MQKKKKKKKKLLSTHLFKDFSKAFDSIHRRKMMLSKITKVKVCSPDGDTDFFDIVADALQADTLAPYLFIVYQDYVLRTSTDLMKENYFTIKKERNRRYLSLTITDANYADNKTLVVNTKPKPNPCCIVWTRQQVALVSIVMQTKRSTCVLIKKKKRKRLHNKWRFFEIIGQVPILRKQHLIYWKWHQCGTSEDIDCHR